jgi:hypothetical protein
MTTAQLQEKREICGECLTLREFAAQFENLDYPDFMEILDEHGYLEPLRPLPLKPFVDDGTFGFLETETITGDFITVKTETLVTPEGQGRLYPEIQGYLKTAQYLD